ncbi:hypothetical protein K1719_040065 [Acacia pycnantha]|nr:hypothetical protein K1719_040065 [Acacia pycnantha]
MIEIWDALRAAAEADITLAQAIVDSAGVIVQSSDLTVCYDERGKGLKPRAREFCNTISLEKFCDLPRQRFHISQ